MTYPPNPPPPPYEPPPGEPGRYEQPGAYAQPGGSGQPDFRKPVPSERPAPQGPPESLGTPSGDTVSSAPSGPPDADGAAEHRPAGFDPKGRVKRGRVSAVWVGLIAAAIVLILLIVFIAQNLKNASIHFLGWSGKFPIGLTVLIAAVIGLLVVAIPGSIRIFQLRRALKINTPKDQRI